MNALELKNILKRAEESSKKALEWALDEGATMEEIEEITKKNLEEMKYIQEKMNAKAPVVDVMTLTFGERVENHAGMQMIGDLSDSGYSLTDLIKVCKRMRRKGYTCELYNLGRFVDDCPDGYVLIIRNAVEFFVPERSVYEEQLKLDFDKKAYMRGRVVNKRARYNLCFGEKAQEPDYANKKGRIVYFDSVPYTKKIRKKLHKMFGSKAKNLLLEGNYYYDMKECGIGMHGDSERRIVIGLRLGKPFNLMYRWYQNGQPISEDIEFTLNGGDMYIMSDKAVGFDWKKRKIKTLRHGCGNYNKFLKAKVAKLTQ